MPTDHCSRCRPNNPCGNGHLYVIQLDYGIMSLTQESVYVGSTGKSVEERWQDNLTRKDGTVHTLEQAREIGEDGGWKYQGPRIKQIRKYYAGHRPDLYFNRNPGPRDSELLQLLESQFAKELQEQGYDVLSA